MEWDIIDKTKDAFFILHNDRIFKINKVEDPAYKKLFITVTNDKLVCNDQEFLWMYIRDEFEYKQVIDEDDPDLIEYEPVYPSQAWLTGKSMRRLVKQLSKITLEKTDFDAMMKAQPLANANKHAVFIDSLSQLKF